MKMQAIESDIFTPVSIGPVTIRNRIIRSAAFENMAYGNRPSKDLMDYQGSTPCMPRGRRRPSSSGIAAT